MLPVKTRYKIIKVPASGIQKINFKIPEDFIMITGIHINSGRIGIGGKPIGTVSLSFNNKASNPILLNFDSENTFSKTRKTEFLELKEPLTGGTYIQGYVDFEFTGAGSYFKITLRGKKVYRNG